MNDGVIVITRVPWELWVAFALALGLTGALLARRLNVYAGRISAALVIALVWLSLAPRPALQPEPVLITVPGTDDSPSAVTGARTPVPVSAPGMSASPGRPNTDAALGGPDALPTAKPSAGQSLSGVATWYAATGLIGAAGPDLRAWLGSSWRGSWITVTVRGPTWERAVRIRLSDWCACADRNGVPTLVDLSDDAFRRLSPLGAGVLRVTVGR